MENVDVRQPPDNNTLHTEPRAARLFGNNDVCRGPVNVAVMLRGVDRTAEAVNTLPWLERWMHDVGLKSDFSDEKWIGLIKSAVFAGAKS